MSTLWVTAGCALAISNSSAAAQTSPAYPSKPVRIMVPFPAGGGFDIAARGVAQKLFEALKYQFIVDNRPGAGGTVGTQTAARAAPDGYTLLVGGASGMVINPLLTKNLPYDPLKDFAPVSLIAINPTLLVVHGSLPVSTVKELVAYAKARPGKLSYASVGSGSPIHIGMELFKSLTGTNMVHVPYKGAAPAVTDLLGGQVELMFNTMPSVLPHVKSGKLKALAVGTARRSRLVPDLPTVAEAGVPGFQLETWFGLFAPTRTPRHIINTLNTHLVRGLEDRDLAQSLANQGSEPQPSTPEKLAQYMREDAERWGKVIRSAGIKADE